VAEVFSIYCFVNTKNVEKESFVSFSGILEMDTAKCSVCSGFVFITGGNGLAEIVPGQGRSLKASAFLFCRIKENQCAFEAFSEEVPPIFAAHCQTLFIFFLCKL